MKKKVGLLVAGILVAGLSITMAADSCCAMQGMSNKSASATTMTRLHAGKKVVLEDGTSFVYHFSQKPALGTVVVIVRVSDEKGKLITPYSIVGNSGMPSMSGAHDSGDVAFQLNQKNEYLLPVNVVMQGAWEVKVIFKKADKALYTGVINFKV